MDFDRLRRKKLAHLGARQKADDEVLLRKLPPVARRVRVDNAADRPALERSVGAYRGLVTKAITCSCGHAATVRVPLGAPLRCSKCGKGC